MLLSAENRFSARRILASLPHLLFEPVGCVEIAIPLRPREFPGEKPPEWRILRPAEQGLRSQLHPMFGYERVKKGEGCPRLTTLATKTFWHDRFRRPRRDPPGAIFGYAEPELLPRPRLGPGRPGREPGRSGARPLHGPGGPGLARYFS